MAWMKVSEYRDTFSERSKPTRRTIIKRIWRGELVGKNEGGMWYVDPDRDPLQPTIQETADALFQTLTARPHA